MLSPGVPADLEVLQSVRVQGIPVIGDLELASWFLKGEIIGITGSNGKTTTTAMTGHILQASGIRGAGGRQYRHAACVDGANFARRAVECSGALELPA